MKFGELFHRGTFIVGEIPIRFDVDGGDWYLRVGGRAARRSLAAASGRPHRRKAFCRGGFVEAWRALQLASIGAKSRRASYGMSSLQKPLRRR